MEILFNNALNAFYCPKYCKQPKILFILKNAKDPLKATSFRPMSLTPTSKVYKTIINIQFNKFCNENNIIPDQQLGFKHEHSTVHTINKLTSNIQRYLHYNQLVSAVLIHLEKEFDAIWIDGLILKLRKLKFCGWLIFIVLDMMCDKTPVKKYSDQT